MDGVVFKRSLVALVLGLITVFAAGFSSAADITGAWVVKIVLPDGGGDINFNLVQKGEDLTGTYSGNMGTNVPVTGKVKGNQVEFSFEPSEGKVSYQGEIKPDGTMAGKAEYATHGQGTWAGAKAKK